MNLSEFLFAVKWLAMYELLRREFNGDSVAMVRHLARMLHASLTRASFLSLLDSSMSDEVQSQWQN